MIDEKAFIAEIEEEANTRFNGLNSGISFEDLIAWIEQLPKINTWIPCNEQLPTESGRYLTHFKDERWGDCVEICHYQHLPQHWFCLVETLKENPDTWKRIENVIEWQPLPKI